MGTLIRSYERLVHNYTVLGAEFQICEVFDEGGGVAR